MLGKRELLRYWTDQGVYKYDVASFLGMNLPKESLHLLTEVGVPKKELVYGIRFSDSPERLDLPHFTGLVVGSQLGERPICLMRDTGHLTMIEDDVDEGYIFLNSDIVRFAKFYMWVAEIQEHWQQWENERPGIHDLRSRVCAMLDTAEQKMRELDPPAMEYRTHTSWWHIVMDEARMNVT